MNERIFELAKQADLIQWDTLPSGARTPDHESVVKAKKFAELILVDLISEFDQSMTGEEDSVDYGLHLAKVIIKERFGVE
jgi:hypothetical protein